MQKYNLFTNTRIRTQTERSRTAHTITGSERKTEKDDPHLSMSAHFVYTHFSIAKKAKKERKSAVCVSTSQNMLLGG